MAAKRTTKKTSTDNDRELRIIAIGHAVALADRHGPHDAAKTVEVAGQFLAFLKGEETKVVE